MFKRMCHRGPDGHCLGLFFFFVFTIFSRNKETFSMSQKRRWKFREGTNHLLRRVTRHATLSDLCGSGWRNFYIRGQVVTDASICSNNISPITVDARCKAWTFFALSVSGVVASNPTQGTDVCSVLCVGSGLATDWSFVQGVLPFV
jgi:hypothetical protein